MHTKGPWRYYHERTGGCFVVASVKDGAAVAETFTTSELSEANARLIAAAPGLLEDLELISRIATNAGSAPSHEDALNILLDIANLALEARRKAKGE